jgi:hypothetical protein
MSDGDHLGDFEQRLDALETSQARTISQLIKPALDELREDRDDARQERVELREQVRSLQQQVNAVYGLADDERSTPAKRAADLRMALIRRANSQTGPNGGRSSMHYKEVQDCFADIGHETVHAPECYDAMDEAALADGFSLGTKAKNGEQIKAIRVDTEALPAGVAISDPTNGTGGGSRQDGLISDHNTSED